MRIPATLTVPTLCLAVALSLGTTVSADGLASKNRSRIPMYPGLTVNRDLLREAFILTPSVPSKTERVAAKIRRDERAAARTIVHVASVPTDVTVSPSVVIFAPGRDRLASKGQFVPSQCQGLHTHDRATCIYAAQLKKTVRLQTVTQK